MNVVADAVPSDRIAIAFIKTKEMRICTTSLKR